ncbi:ferredoxin [Microbacterium sp. A196]|uniref:ferredoxin n=1 Tax=Microbacterium sp. A196 TaxID=3457320 RepID=UPI003FCF3F99
MTSVVVDPTKCVAYGICVAVHPEVFEIPAGSPVATVIRDVLQPDDLDDVREAIRACPAQALTLAEA